ncbi:MbcA/ParS/Xre antitoxin family protein [Nostoc sp. CHAB 5834]|nr:MbcA/ParS/Xre antitoxin family protein [Nostoc sp. CHAB 5834]
MLYELLGFRDNEFPGGMGWHAQISQGFHQKSLWALTQSLNVAPRDIASLVGIPLESIGSVPKNLRISPHASDALFRVAVAVHRLEVILKNPEHCATWLRTARKELQGRIPILLLTTPPGSVIVFNAISQVKPVKKTSSIELPRKSDEPGVELLYEE